MTRAGMNGPGQMPTRDVQQRNHQAGGAMPGDRGLFAQNPYASRRGRERLPPGPDPALMWLVRYGVSLLLKALRSQPGINVRLPSHVNPPFRSAQYTFQQLGTAMIVPQTFAISFNGNTNVPDGVRGVVSYFEFAAFPNDIDIVSDPDTQTLSLFKNGLGVPGFQNVLGSRFEFETVADIAGSQNDGARFVLPLTTPIQLEPGDTLAATIVGTGATSGDFRLTVAGYLYPIEVEADGITGTMADRGLE